MPCPAVARPAARRRSPGFASQFDPGSVPGLQNRAERERKTASQRIWCYNSDDFCRPATILTMTWNALAGVYKSISRLHMAPRLFSAWYHALPMWYHPNHNKHSRKYACFATLYVHISYTFVVRLSRRGKPGILHREGCSMYNPNILPS